MRRKSAAPAINALRLRRILRPDLSALAVDDDQMQTRCLYQARELLNPRMPRGVLGVGDDIVRHASTHREFALAEVCDRARGPKISIGREIIHEAIVVHGSPVRSASQGSCGLSKSVLWTARPMTFANALLWRSWATELSCYWWATVLSCCWWAAVLSCCWWATEQSAPPRGSWSVRSPPFSRLPAASPCPGDCGRS
jgi:hypothetical protein